MSITTENGREYQLTITAIEALKAADNAHSANAAFDIHASYVPNRDRCAVWFAV